MAIVAPWEGKVVLDLWTGTGYHIPRFHTLAHHVLAVEPHDPSQLPAMAGGARLGLDGASVIPGSAERRLLADGSVLPWHASNTRSERDDAPGAATPAGRVRSDSQGAYQPRREEGD